MKFNHETSATLNETTGLTKLLSGAITTPVAYIQFVLPAKYKIFVLELVGMKINVADELTAVFSQDSGATWSFDVTNFDTYFMVGHELYASLDNIQALNGGANAQVDSLMDIAGLWGGARIASPDDIGMSATIKFFPGDASHLPSGRLEATHQDDFRTPNDLVHSTYSFALNPAATVAPANGRLTNIALTPYGNGDFPPTSGETITAGSYVLWGMMP